MSNYFFDSLALDVISFEAVSGSSPSQFSAVSGYAHAISWQQFILDLHSGFYFGSWGVLSFEIVGFSAILIAVSGIVIWRNPR